MAQQYYDPNTWQTIDPSRVKKRDAFYNPTEYGTPSYGESFWYDGTPGGVQQTSEGSWWEDPTGKEARYGDVLQDYLGQFGTKTRNYLSGLNTQYGLGVNDFQNAIQSYIKNSNTDANQQSLSWQGDEGSLYMFGQGLDYLNPTAAYKGSWEPMFNRGAYNSQQYDIGKRVQDAQNVGGSDMGDLMDILKGVGVVAGVGALGGAFGGLGATGGGGADLAAAFGDTGLGYGAGSASMGGAAGMGAASAGNLVPPVELAGSPNPALPGYDFQFQNMSAPAANGGNGMDWLDELVNLTSDTPSVAQSGDPLSGLLNSGNGGSSMSLSDTVYADDAALGQGMNAPQGGVIQQAVDLGVPFDIASKVPTPTLNQLMSLMRGAAGGAGGTAAQGSALSRILGGNGSSSDWTSLLGLLGTGALSAYSANQNASAMKEIADRSWNAGAPYRDKLSATYSNPGAYLDSPEVQAILNRSQNALARSLSARDGNPIGSGRALNEMNDYAAQTMLGQLGNYRQQLANFGGQSALSGTYPQLGSQAADASSNIYNSLANTVSRVTQPQTDWQNILRMYGGGNGLA